MNAVNADWKNSTSITTANPNALNEIICISDGVAGIIVSAINIIFPFVSLKIELMGMSKESYRD